MKVTVERENLQQKWGFSLQGGQEMTLTLKVASVKVGAMQTKLKLKTNYL